MRHEYPSEYDEPCNDSECANCGGDIPGLTENTLNDPEFMAHWNGFCSVKCEHKTEQEVKARNDARFAIESSAINCA